MIKYLLTLLLQIYCRVWWWKNFENRLTFRIFTGKNKVAPFFRTRCSVLALSVEGTSYDKNTTSHLVIENEFQMSYAEVYWIMFSPFQRPNQLGVCSVRENFSNNVSHKHRPSNNSTHTIWTYARHRGAQKVIIQLSASRYCISRAGLMHHAHHSILNINY